MSSRHTTLEQYLARRRAQTNHYGAGIEATQGMSTGTMDPLSRNRQVWETNFFGAKRQCLEQLARIKDGLECEQQYITQWLGSYESNVLLMMDSQYQKIKQEVLVFMDAGHNQNKRKVKDGFKNYGGPAAAEIQTIRSKLANVRSRIEQLEQELESGASYKRGIIDVVGSDFETERDQIVSRLSQAFHRYESMVYLKVDATRFARMKEDATNLFFVDSANVLQNMNPPDGSIRFSYQQLPAAITPTTVQLGAGQWNNTNFQEPPKKSFC